MIFALVFRGPACVRVCGRGLYPAASACNFTASPPYPCASSPRAYVTRPACISIRAGRAPSRHK